MTLSNIQGPRTGAVAAVEHSSQSTDGWKDQAVVEDPLEDLLLDLQPLGFFLCGAGQSRRMQRTAWYVTSSMGPKYMRWSMEYF